ncbi:unconventional myosin-Va-like isoform X3 [Haliotis cracherodii]|uniref:unconventional myosin-Va-like isoform X3 n=1 Tax=Haliotis cracherodii TaxID=6455 RepID=UPI0039ECC13A
MDKVWKVWGSGETSRAALPKLIPAVPEVMGPYQRFDLQYVLKEIETADHYVEGARVWIPDPVEVWRAAELLEAYTGQPKLKIQYEEGEGHWTVSTRGDHPFQKPKQQWISLRESVIEIKEKNLPHLRNPDILIGENDLTSLSYLNEPEVLYNLQVRFVQQNLIYTYCGIVLVAINPYEQLDIYNNDIIQAYSGQDMGAMDPHIFAVAEEAFKKMSRFDENQSIIVSGESGAGKTVSAKYAMRYFATVGGSQADSETQVEKKVLASNPIMEAIGNAKTTRNDNSSRFGKYIEITFSRKHEIIGANMRTYLLEKSRVVFQAEEERNYHIFYQLCASADLPELADMKLKAADDFFYTCHGGSPEINGVDDAHDFQTLREAFSLLGFSAKDQMMIFRIMSSVLHFGNVVIREKEGECCEVPKQDEHLTVMCKLLGIEESQMRMWLCNRSIQTVNETLTKPLTESQASFARDALAKHIYSRMFDWIVAHVNNVLRNSVKTKVKLNFIGVLDIYGFETFVINSFEQFCINYANEKLQQIFNMHVFKLEQEEYVREKIEWSFIDFYDNQPCIDLIENKLGILDLLDEECKMPKGSDQNWCQKLFDKHLKKSKHFDKPRMSMKSFIIIHFADRVTYTADGFLEKNRDTILEEQINILKASEFDVVAQLFEEASDKKTRSGSVTVTPLRQSAKTGSKQHKKTVGSQFRDSLKLLMETLNATTPHYIRCIKPNDLKEAFEFNSTRAVEQLRACGVLETIRISAAGYPSRWTYAEFFQRYRVLAISKDILKKNLLKTCENILIKLIADPDKYRFGKTKIFFRAGQVAYLEKLRADKLRACGVMIQKHIRGWLLRRKYQRIRKSVLLVQRFGRGLLARRMAVHLRQTHAAIVIQSKWRSYRKWSVYRKLRTSVILLQAKIRGNFARERYIGLMKQKRAVTIQRTIRAFLARKRYKRVMRGIILLQSHVRRRKAKRELKTLKIEAKSVEHIKHVNKGLENKIIELQQKLDTKAKAVQALQVSEKNVEEMKTEIQKLRSSDQVAKTSSNRVRELEEEIARLKEDLESERGEKEDVISEKQLLQKNLHEMVTKFEDEQVRLKEDLDAANLLLKQQEEQNTQIIKEKLEAANKRLLEEFESERGHHQKMVREHGRLQQRLENLQGEMSVLKSPTGGHHRTPSDISAISVDSYSSSADVERGAEDRREDDEDLGYETTKRKAAPPTSLLETVLNEVTGKKEGEPLDVGLVLKLQNRVKELERDKQSLQRRVERMEEDSPRASPTMMSDSAFEALKQEMGANADDVALVIKLQKRVKALEVVKNKLTNELEERDDNENGKERIGGDLAYESLKMQELQNENDKLKREVSSLNKSIAASTNFDNSGKMSPAGKKFLDELEAMREELDRRRDECLHLRAELADRSITTHTVAKESYGGHDEMVNEDDEIVMAFKTQKDLNRLLQTQLDKTEKDFKKKEDDLHIEIKELKKENDRQQKLIGQLNEITSNLTLGPEARIEATMQHEITRLTSENLDLREMIDKQSDQIRKLKKMLKVYSKKLKDGEAAEIQAELEQEERSSANGALATVKHRQRIFLGMLEYKREDEGALLKNLILDLRAKFSSGQIPGLPAYILFMCVRHTDYTNDDEKVRSLLTGTINSIKKVVKKHPDDMERCTMWLANTCRLLHTLKQYSGEKTFQAENTPKQNEQCLRNFDLSEYRQVFSDLAVWVYQGLIKVMQEMIQPNIVPAVLEHEAIAGLTASKPSGLRGRSSSTARDPDEDDSKMYSLDSLMRSLNSFMRIVTQHAVDPELVKQIFRQLYYFICAGALNNLLLRKDMCNWSKGMQIRYNISHLEQWLRDNKLHESGATGTLDTVIQASQLLQARKTDADVESVCEMCSKLTLPQIVKILNLYTPVDEFEERVPISFIRKIQEKLRNREGTTNTLLMETKFSYPVTFPFNPSSIAMETIEVPEQLHLGFLKRI